MKKIISLLLTAALALCAAGCGASADNTAAPADPAAPELYIPEIVRISDSDRIGTSLAISEKGWNEEGAENVIIASGYSFADALAGAPLAAALKAPIILTAKDAVEQKTLNRLKALNCKNIYILGGEVAVNKSVENKLSAAGYNIKRISGEDRIETSMLIAEELKSITGKAFDNVFITSGKTYPDALSISPVAGLKLSPILYTDNNGVLNSNVTDYLSSGGFTSVSIVGGEVAVSKTTESVVKSKVPSAKTVSRVYGSTRYETAIEIFYKYLYLFDRENISVATGEDFPDALAGSAFDTKYKLPIFLVNTNGISEWLEKQIVSISPKKVYVFGGTNVISDLAIDKIVNARPNYIKRTVKITSKSCKLYSAPGSSNKVIGSAVYGKSYSVICSDDDEKGTTWFKIKVGNTEGWIIRTTASITNSYTKIPDKKFTGDKKPVIFLSPSRQPGNLFYNKITNEQEQMEKITKRVKEILDSEYDCVTNIAPSLLTLKERYEYAYQLKSDIYIAIHSNALEQAEPHTAQEPTTLPPAIKASFWLKTL